MVETRIHSDHYSVTSTGSQTGAKSRAALSSLLAHACENRLARGVASQAQLRLFSPVVCSSLKAPFFQFRHLLFISLNPIASVNRPTASDTFVPPRTLCIKLQIALSKSFAIMSNESYPNLNPNSQGFNERLIGAKDSVVNSKVCKLTQLQFEVSRVSAVGSL